MLPQDPPSLQLPNGRPCECHEEHIWGALSASATETAALGEKDLGLFGTLTRQDIWASASQPKFGVRLCPLRDIGALPGASSSAHCSPETTGGIAQDSIGRFEAQLDEARRVSVLNNPSQDSRELWGLYWEDIILHINLIYTCSSQNLRPIGTDRACLYPGLHPSLRQP